MSSGIRKSLHNGKEGLHWENLVGFDSDMLEKRLKKTIPAGYSWSEYEAGKTDLEIDHIIPIAAFNFSDYRDLDFRRCWSLNNLRLFPKTDNRVKNDRITNPFQPSLSMSL